MNEEMLVILTQILVSLHFMVSTFPDLFGMQPQREAPPSLAPTIFVEEDNDDEFLNPILHGFQSNLVNFVMMASYKPRARVTASMWVKDRTRTWFDDFMLQYDEERWLLVMKMSSCAFNWLCNVLAPYIQMHDTTFRKALPVNMRVAVVLFKLLWAATYMEMSETFGIGRSYVYEILRQVVPAINHVLGYHIQWQGGSTLQHSMIENEKRLGIPNVVGAIDCTHIRIDAPRNKINYDYRNRTGYYSISLQGVVDPYAKFLDIYVGEHGSMNDARVLRLSPLYQPASNGTLLQGEDVVLANGGHIPPILIGDAIYHALPWLVSSYKRCPGTLVISRMKSRFNKKLSKARIYSEIAFGRLKITFKEVGWKSNLDIEFLPDAVHTCCILYNILVDFKEVDFESVFNEVDALNAILARDNETYALEPVVDRSHLVGSDLRDVLCHHVNFG